jgi:hypothetical protein
MERSGPRNYSERERSGAVSGTFEEGEERERSAEYTEIGEREWSDERAE